MSHPDDAVSPPSVSHAVVPFVARPLVGYSPPQDGAASAASGAVVPLTAAHLCPFCQRPFRDDYEQRSASATTTSSCSSGGEDEGARPPHSDHRRRRRKPRAARQRLTPQYFRSLPPLDTEDLLLRSAAGSSRDVSPAPEPLPGSTGPGAGDVGLEEDDVWLERLMQEGYYCTNFVEVHKIGGGSFGAVFLCRHVVAHLTLGLFAVKKIPVGGDPTYLANVLHEVRIMSEIKRHPNVLEYNHCWVDYARPADFGPIVRCLFVLMEYATEGSLDYYLSIHGFTLPDVAVWYFFLSAVAGLAHLHAKGIVHRDMKPQNLLLTKVEGRAPRLLVADFGTAALLNEISLCERTGGTGTLEYMAPELFETANSPTSAAEERYLYPTSKASDVWSLGMVLHYLACAGSLPTVLADGSVVIDLSRTAPIQRPPEMEELMRRMLHRDPTKRPSCADILRTNVVQGILRSLENVDFSRSDTKPSHASKTNSSAADDPLRSSPPPARAPLLLGYRPRPLSREPSTVGRGTAAGHYHRAVADAHVQTDADGANWEEFIAWKSRQ